MENNPIAAFIPENYIPEYLEKQFSRETRPLSEEEVKILIKEYISPKGFLNENKTGILNKIYKDSQIVYQLLKPLEDMGFEYTLDLTGGAVRDFVLNNHELIKDLDFMLKIENHSHGAFNVIRKYFSDEELNNIEYTLDPKLTDFQQKSTIDCALLSLCLNRANNNSILEENKQREYKIYKSYVIDNVGESFETQQIDRLSGVVKLEDIDSNYPIDILLTDRVKPEFLEGFDFDICKASFSLVNPFYKKKFPTNYSHLISRFVAPASFWADFKNKKTSFDPSDLSLWQIERSILHHLPRIKEKYKEFDFNLLGDSPIQIEQTRKVLELKDLSTSLNEKSISNTSTKKMKV